MQVQSPWVRPWRERPPTSVQPDSRPGSSPASPGAPLAALLLLPSLVPRWLSLECPSHSTRERLGGGVTDKL